MKGIALKSAHWIRLILTFCKASMQKDPKALKLQI